MKIFLKNFDFYSPLGRNAVRPILGLKVNKKEPNYNPKKYLNVIQ